MTDLVPMMPKYEAYKDSGVAWIGEIPVEWSVKKIKWEITAKSGTDAKDNNGEYNLYGANGIIGKCSTPSLSGDSIIVGRVGSAGSVTCISGKAGVSDNALILSFKALNACRYDYYLLKSIRLEDLIEKNAQPLLTATNLKNIKVAIPPSIFYRNQIANFLDCKTEKIDQAVAIKEKQIQLLKERRQILIQTAVTKGLDPDVPMRNSGVEWLGEVPGHWELMRLKYLFTEVNKRTETGSETLFSLRMEKGLIPHNEVSDKHIADENLINYKVVYPGQLVMNRMRASIGIFGAAHDYGLVSPDYTVFNMHNQVCAYYYLLMFKTSLLGTQFRLNSRGMGTGSSGFMRLYTENFGDIKVPYPSFEEQKAIVTHIRTQSDKIDKAIAIQEQMIDKLKEYKATLINAAVTGKIKVPKTAQAKAVA